jgi:hypothetical protein
MVPTIETTATTIPMRFAPRDVESSFREQGRTWTVLMVDPVNWWTGRRDQVEVLWRVGQLRGEAGEVRGTILGWYYAAADGLDFQVQFEICEVDGRPAMTHLEMFSLNERSALPTINLPTQKLVKHAEIVGNVFGDAKRSRSRWIVKVREFRDPDGDLSRRLPRKHRTQVARCFDAYTTAPYGKRIAAVMDATGLGIDSANTLVKEMKQDKEYGPMFRAWKKRQQKGGKK